MNNKIKIGLAIFIPAWCAAMLMIVIYVSSAYPATLPTGPTGSPQVSVPPQCMQVSATRYNAVLKQAKHVGHHKKTRYRSKPICKNEYNTLKKRVVKWKRDCRKHAHSTQASVFTPGADSGGMTGACGKYLGGFKFMFAELGYHPDGSGGALGGLPCHSWIFVYVPGGGMIRVQKEDTGCGNDSPVCNSPGRGIDFWLPGAQTVGMGKNSTNQVRWSKYGCW